MEKRPSDWKCLETLQKRSNKLDMAVAGLALLLSILLHICLYYSVPDTFYAPVEKEALYENLELEILPPLMDIPKIPEYIEANPFANKEKPKDSVTKDSFQDQRAKDMIVDVKSDSDKPFVDGELEESQKIVEGNLSENPQKVEAMEITKIMERELAPLDLKNVSSEQNVEVVVQEEQAKISPIMPQQDSSFSGDSQALKEDAESAPTQAPTAELASESQGESALDDIFSELEMQPDGELEIEKSALKEFKDKESTADNILPMHSIKGDSKEDIAKQKKQEILEQTEQTVVEALPVPKQRKTISKPAIDFKSIPAPLANNNSRASELGIVAVDSSFSEFGAYQQRMLEAISRQWILLSRNFTLSNIANTVVKVEFFLNSEGSITTFRILYSNSSEVGKSLCEQAIWGTAPYGKWTEDMYRVFGGNDQSVRITFHYR